MSYGILVKNDKIKANSKNTVWRNGAIRQVQEGDMKVTRETRALNTPADAAEADKAVPCSESFKRVAPSPLPCSSKHLDAVKLRADAGVGGGHETEYSDSEYDNEKQQSPVSVLEHPFDSSPVHGQSRFSCVQDSPKNAMAIVRELLMEMETAYTPALRTQLFDKSEDLVNDTNDLVDHDGDDDYYYRTSPKNFHEADDARPPPPRAPPTGRRTERSWRGCPS
uniref:Uncharacterized protein n=1 Tax=Aegilops tauschii TaxID=37682 RepID=M8AQ65_AEGTA